MSEPEYIVYIDEAGEPGLHKVRPDDPDGSSEWLTLGAVLVRAKREPEIVDWVKHLRTTIGATQGPELHFRNLSDTRKVQACAAMSALPLRAFCIASNKRNMKGYHNAKATKIPSQEWFYNWLSRLVLERVSDLVWRQSMKEHGKPSLVKIIFSHKGGHAYSQTRAYVEYLKRQETSGTTVLIKREIRPQVLSMWQIEHERSKFSAGAQLADVIASAFYFASDGNYQRPPFIEPAKQLWSIMARERGRVDDYGLALMPTPFQSELVLVQKRIFEYYGHVLSGR
ncbi:DUF3800 domain-containing protein [Devosia alba]|uniref:DUF3800 domain-containing protein n=1 Tax=Devosia alba TaxID=3152360 RepID=UPI003263B6CA